MYLKILLKSLKFCYFDNNCNNFWVIPNKQVPVKFQNFNNVLTNLRLQQTKYVDPTTILQLQRTKYVDPNTILRLHRTKYVVPTTILRLQRTKYADPSENCSI